MNMNRTSIAWVALLGSIAALVIGYWLPRPLYFTPNLLSQLFGLGLAVALAILLIEGRSRGQEETRRRVVEEEARSALEFTSSLGMTVAKEFAQSLAVYLESKVNLSAREGGGDWDKEFKPLLLQVFRDAQNVQDATNFLSTDDLWGYLQNAESVVRRIRERIGPDRDVQATLVALGDKLDRLDQSIREARLPTSLGEPDRRYHAVGRIGEAIIAVVDASGQMHRTA